jgi:hypothetical protein
MIHEIVLVPSVGQSGREQLRQQCYDVRIDVFHREQGFPLDAEIDEYVSKTLTSAVSMALAASRRIKCGVRGPCLRVSCLFPSSSQTRRDS